MEIWLIPRYAEDSTFTNVTSEVSVADGVGIKDTVIIQKWNTTLSVINISNVTAYFNGTNFDPNTPFTFNSSGDDGSTWNNNCPFTTSISGVYSCDLYNQAGIDTYTELNQLWLKTQYSTSKMFSLDQAYIYVEFSIPSCVPLWVANLTPCGFYNDTWDTKYKYYIDQNNCSSPLGLPADNGTISSCDYCISTWDTFTTACNISDAQVNYSSYTNTCCDTTNLSSDCNKPDNFSQFCPFCEPTWICTAYDLCTFDYGVKEYSPCLTVFDTSCGGLYNYTGDFTEFEQYCNYCNPDWICSNFSACDYNTFLKTCQDVADVNGCYATTGLPTDTYSGNLSEIPKLECNESIFPVVMSFNVPEWCYITSQLVIEEYPFVELGKTYHLKIYLPCNDDFVNISNLTMILDNYGQDIHMNFTYNPTEKYFERYISFQTVGNFSFDIVGEDPNHEINVISGEFKVRIPYYLHLVGVNSKNTTRYINQFGYVLAEPVTTPPMIQFTGMSEINNQLFGELAYNKPVFWARYEGGEATLKLYEKQDYKLRLVDGQIRFLSNYDVPIIDKAYGINFDIGTYDLSDNDTKYFYVSQRDTDYWGWLFNIVYGVMVFLLLVVAIAGIFTPAPLQIASVSFIVFLMLSFIKVLIWGVRIFI